jgi:hypothetical protein
MIESKLAGALVNIHDIDQTPDRVGVLVAIAIVNNSIVYLVREGEQMIHPDRHQITFLLDDGGNVVYDNK